MSLVNKILQESKESIKVFRIEFSNSGKGPFNLSENEPGFSSFVQNYIEDRINKRFTEKLTSVQYKVPKGYVFGFSSINSIKKYFEEKDLKFLLGVGFVLNVYEAKEFKVLTQDEIIFKKSTSKLIQKGKVIKLTDEEFNELMDEDY
jgi:hypothetical protein